MNFEKTTPDWQLYDFEKYPAVQWKLKEMNPQKHLTGVLELQEKLERGENGDRGHKVLPAIRRPAGVDPKQD